MNFKSLLKTSLPILCVFAVIAILGNTEAFGQLQPQSNPFGTRGDTALGGFGANLLTIVNAIAFYGGIVCVFWAVFNIATSKPWLPQALGAVGGVGGWTVLGAVAYQLGSNQAFQIPGIS